MDSHWRDSIFGAPRTGVGLEMNRCRRSCHRPAPGIIGTILDLFGELPAPEGQSPLFEMAT
jgi:hypothetical protein